MKLRTKCDINDCKQKISYIVHKTNELLLSNADPTGYFRHIDDENILEEYESDIKGAEESCGIDLSRTKEMVKRIRQQNESIYEIGGALSVVNHEIAYA